MRLSSAVPGIGPWWGCNAPLGGSQRAEPCLLNALDWVRPPYPELRLREVPLPGKHQTPQKQTSVRYFPAGKLRSGDTPRPQQSGGSEGPQEGECHLPPTNQVHFSSVFEGGAAVTGRASQLARQLQCFSGKQLAHL